MKDEKINLEESLLVAVKRAEQASLDASIAAEKAQNAAKKAKKLAKKVKRPSTKLKLQRRK